MLLAVTPVTLILSEKRECPITAPHSFLHFTSVPTGPPQGLRVKRRSTSFITLKWRDPPRGRINDRDGVIGFEVRRNGERVANVTGWNYTFTGLSNATSYNFEILAINEQGVAAGNHAARLNASTKGMQTLAHDKSGSVCLLNCDLYACTLYFPSSNPI